jgi:hypothetical protein
MLKRRFRLPSPALVISMITLSLVLGGTAVAATTSGHADKKADTKLIKKLAPTLSVKHAKTANSATNAVNATSATNAANATHATSADSATNATNATHATAADSATNATNASTVNGQLVTPIFATVAPGAAAIQVYSKQGLTLTFSCPTSVNDQVVANGPAAANDNLVVQGNGQAGAFQSRTEHMGSSSNVVIGSGNYGTGVAEYGTSDGHVVSVTYGFDDAVSGISSDCSLWGVAVSS